MTVGMPDNGRRFAPVRTKYLACLYGNVYVTINQVQILEYLDAAGDSPYRTGLRASMLKPPRRSRLR